jgi:hypothetical protein
VHARFDHAACLSDRLLGTVSVDTADVSVVTGSQLLSPFYLTRGPYKILLWYHWARGKCPGRSMHLRPVGAERRDPRKTNESCDLHPCFEISPTVAIKATPAPGRLFFVSQP